VTEIEQWWHAFTNEGKCSCGVTMTIVLGESSLHPELMMARIASGELKIDLTCLCCGDACLVVYIRSWNHEPNPVERVAAGLDPENIISEGWGDDEFDDDDMWLDDDEED
jgi:hypothetical protein